MSQDGFPFELTILPLTESAILVRMGDGEAIDPAIVDAVGALALAIDRAAISGVTDVVPAYATILVELDAERTDGATVEEVIRRLAVGNLAGPDEERRVVIIPVAYGGEYGPDLEETATTLALTSEEVVRLHTGAKYQVACLGFSPGWAYLMGLPSALTIPRRKEPRTRIPAGSVAIGGAQTGVYPSETPGGWHLLGRTPLRMFDPHRSEPSLLRTGDYVRFAPIDEERFDAIARELDGTHE